MNLPGRLTVFLSVVILAVSIAMIGGVAFGGSAVVVAEDSDEENESIRHENPDTYGEGADDDLSSSWLAGALSEQLRESSIEISEGEYERGKELLGEEYRERLDQYVEVRDDEDDEAESEFEETADEQETYAETLELFYETLEEYEEAIEEGDDDRARELARELVALAEELDEISLRLSDLYERLEDETGDDFSEARESIEETRQETNETTHQIQNQVFVETALVVEADGDAISFLEPLSATGELETADGSLPESITVEVRGERQRADVDDEGRFQVGYHPVDLPLDTESVTVTYVPDGESVYLGSEANVAVSVEQVDSTIVDLNATDVVAYDESLAIDGTVAVDGASDGEAPTLDGLPLVVTLDGERLGETRTTNGTVEDEFRIPATVSDGDAELRVTLPYEGRAVGGTSETRSVLVEETATTISVDGELDGGEDGSPDDESDDGTVHVDVAGSLETVDGEALANQSIEIRIDGSSVTTVETEDGGTFTANASVPAGAGESLEIEAVFDGSETNLADTSTGTSIELPPAETGPSTLTWVVVALVAGGLLLGVGGWYWYRRQSAETIDGSGTGDAEESDAVVGAAGRSADDEDGAIRTDDSPSPITVAADLLSSGQPDEAVTAAYAAVRRTLAAQVEDAERRTHWEFYAGYRGTGRETLRELTERYERAAFAPEGCSEGEASTVLERARELCGVDGGERDRGDGDRRSQPVGDD